jgi:RNA polymerase sigma-70 factor (ECF subfamily)
MESSPAVMSQPPAPFPGQPVGLEELFRAHHESVLRAAYRITGNATDAEDVLQTVFMRLLRRPADAPPMTDAAAYLHRAAVNAALDLVRDRHPAKNQPLDAHLTHLAESPAAAPDRRREASEIRALLHRAIRRLPPRAAEIFALYYFEDYSNQQIANMLGLSASGVAVTLHRTRARLQEEVRNFMGEVL